MGEEYLSITRPAFMIGMVGMHLVGLFFGFVIGRFG